MSRTALVMCMRCGQKLEAESFYCPSCGRRHIRKSDYARVGDRVGGKYRLVRPFGDRDGGVAYYAESTDRKVVVKVAAEPARIGEESIREVVEPFVGLSDPRLVEVLDFGLRSDGRFFVIFDQPAGRTLADLIEERGAMKVAEAVSILTQLGQALAKSDHRPHLRRDLRPPNVFLMPDGQIRWIDFRIMKAIEAAAGLSPSLDDPRYLAPEQAQEPNRDARADLFALGVLGYELIHGVPPGRPAARLEGAPEWLAVLVAHLIDPNPASRPASANDFLAVMRAGPQQTACTEPAPSAAYVSPSAAGAAPQPYRSKTWSVITVLAIALAALIVLAGR